MRATEDRIDQTPNHAAALAGLKPEEAIWQALQARFDLAIMEANDFATHHDTPEEKRAGWAGRERGLQELWAELEQLQSGQWDPERAARTTAGGKVGKGESER